MASETRKFLHGSRWPTSNPKTLEVDFATDRDVSIHRVLNGGEGSSMLIF